MRLTMRSGGIAYWKTGENAGYRPDDVCFKSEVERLDKLAAYEDAEEQGLLIRLPCRVGDTVWSRDVEPWTVVSVEWFSRKVTRLHCKSPVTGRGMTFSVGKRSLGKTVFLPAKKPKPR